MRQADVIGASLFEEGKLSLQLEGKSSPKEED